MKYIILFCIFFQTLYASSEAISLIKELKLIPGNKATIQWERIFKKERKMKKYGIDKLSSTQKEILKKYLINHAADSDQPMVAGDI